MRISHRFWMSLLIGSILTGYLLIPRSSFCSQSQALLRSASGRCETKFAPALWASSSAMGREKGFAAAHYTTRSGAGGSVRFFPSIPRDVYYGRVRAQLERVVTPIGGQRRAHRCSMRLLLVIPWLRQHKGSLLRASYSERLAFASFLKGKILFLSNSVQPNGISTRRRRSSTLRACWADRGARARTHRDEHYDVALS